MEQKAGTADMREAREIAQRFVGSDAKENEATLTGMIAARAQDVDLLQQAVEALARVAPDGLAANYFATIYQAARGDLGDAEASLERAEKAGLPAEQAALIRADTGIARHLRFVHAFEIAGLLLAAWAAAMLFIFVAGRLMSATALRAIDRHVAEPPGALLAATRSLRRVYAAAIGAAAVYYYLSIPILICLVLGIAGLVLWGVLAAGWIPIKLVVLVVAGAGFTVWALARALFAGRGKDEDPGRRLQEAEAPALWSTLRQVAAEVGTRPVDAVFLTPGTEVAVGERGPMVARLRDHGRRHLILGIGVLGGMTQRQLRAVLAHEYGHFSNRDTAGGDVAATVRASLMTAVLRMARSGSAGSLNPAWQFLRLYYAVFQRMALGASRLQEVLADRHAAVIYGGATFADGLRHVVRRSAEFSAVADATIRRAQEHRRAIANLYVPPEDAVVNRADVESAVQKAMTDPGSPYDSHPPVARRIDWVAAFEAPAAAPGDGPAWDLFPDRTRVEAEMTTLINRRLGEQNLIDPPAPDPAAPPALAGPLERFGR
jgi:Zn-dependent protease with chaperone function